MSESLININPNDLQDPKDSLTIQEETQSPLTSNIYEIASYVDSLKNKYFDNIPTDTLAMGLFGYISELGTNILENTAIMSAEYANEAVPTQAKFERNVLCHALSLGINKIRATPAKMTINIALPEDRLIENMVDNEFILDKNIDINIGVSNGSYTYHLDHDIKIRRNKLPNGKWIYTAMYLMYTHYDMGDVNTNEISDITNPYLPAIGTISISNTNMIVLTTTIRQTNHYEIYEKILVDNPLENKSLSFTFTDQLAYFYVEVVEHTTGGDVTHYLQCLYDGLYNTSSDWEYCNYQYVDESTIRIVFNRDSYQPRENADVTVHVFTTKGSECNFSYNKNTVYDLSSNRYSYNNIYMVVIPQSNSEYGVDKKSVDELKAMIPKQMLMRNSITTYTDLNNFFNSLNTDNIRLYFLQKIHNQIQRIFFCYMLLKDENNNIIPTNTLDVKVTRDMFSNINRINYVLPAGSLFYLENGGTEATGLPLGSSNNIEDLKAKENNGFLYINPFLTVISKEPFVLNYYLNILNYSKLADFDYINDESELQFICTSTTSSPIVVEKPFYPESERDYYTISTLFTQNISTDFDLVSTDENGHIIKNNLRVIGVFYNKDEDGNYQPFRYTEAELDDADYSSVDYSYNYKFRLHTNNIINKDIKLCIDDGIYYVGTRTKAITYLPNNVRFKIFILAKFDQQYGSLKANNNDEDDISYIVPGLHEEKYTLCNIYEVKTGLDMFIDYTNIMESYANLSSASNGELDFHIKRMPLVRYSYFWNFGIDPTEDYADGIQPYGMRDRVDTFIQSIDYRRIYIQSALLLLEDSFGIDMKFFNTYGPSKLYNVGYEKVSMPIDRINISLKFEVKYQTSADKNCKNDIINYIKTYMENMNYISDLHIPNLITGIKNKFYKQIVYIKFIGLNDYGYMYQSIYKNNENDDYLYSTTVPEFININIAKDSIGNDIPDIQIEGVE